jgi:hemerythrin superfamily protein
MQNVKEYLQKDHQEHERLLQRLRRAIDTSASPDEVRQCWLPFERNLLDHLLAEERSLFTVVVQAHREEVEALRAEHRRIRYLVSDLSVSVELQAVRKSEIDRLLEMLRKHTEREEQSLHKWLEMDEGICARRGLSAMLERRARATEQFSVFDEQIDQN